MDNPLIDVLGTGKAADKLIEKISSACFYLYEPFHKKRIAKAEKESQLIKAEGDIEEKELRKRAGNRLLQEQLKKQENIDKIIKKAINDLKEEANPDEMDNDWIFNFFDKGQLISDEQMQEYWSKVLAGEANNPGKFSKHTINILYSLDKFDAQLFKSLCSYVIIIKRDNDLYARQPIIFDENDEIYSKGNIEINYDTLHHLQELRLINIKDFGGPAVRVNTKKTKLYYHEEKFDIIMKETDNNKDCYLLPLGEVMFTSAGKDLVTIIKPEKIEGFMDYIKTKLETDYDRAIEEIT